MLIILVLIALYGMKLSDLEFMQEVSWWWINGAALLAFIWFEYLERMLGFNKSTEDMHHDKIRKERVRRNFKQHEKK